MELIYKDIRNWFNEYTLDYAEGYDRANIILKIEHSRRVAKDSYDIAKALQFDDSDCILAKIIGILHDIGRFEQYRRYGTFSDARSVDHAAFGIEIIKKHGILKELDDNDHEVAIKAVLYHNLLHLPEENNQRVILFARLLRDADKLDIFKVLTEYYLIRHKNRNRTLELDLPENGDFSQEVYEAVMNKQDVDFKNIKNLNDFKLLQAGWIFKLYFAPAIKLFIDRNYFSIIKAALPKDPRSDEIIKKINTYLENNS
jgi:putative nucleotidyltransferase with HDIG domain